MTVKEINRVNKKESSHPKLWHHQYYVLYHLRHAIELVFKNHIRLKSGHKIVDLGCGECPYESIFMNSGCEYLKCDLDNGADIKIEPEKMIPIPSASADGVVSFQVLEHVFEVDWYLDNCCRLLKEEGWLLLSTHGCWPYHPHPGDYRRWTREGIISELKKHGFEIKKVFAIVGPLATTTQYRLLGIYQVLKNVPVLKSIILVPLAILMNLIMFLEDLITPQSFCDVNACIYLTLSYKLKQ